MTNYYYSPNNTYTVQMNYQSSTRNLSRFFFTWGYVKSTVYAQRPQNLADLRREIAAAFQQITPEMLRATWHNMDSRFDLCRVRNGGHVE